jgi:hypothetical protein
MCGVSGGTVVAADAAAGDVVTGEVVTGDVVTGEVVTGEATVVVGSESDEPEHADNTRIPIVDATSDRYLLIVPPTRHRQASSQGFNHTGSRCADQGA